MIRLLRISLTKTFLLIFVIIVSAGCITKETDTENNIFAYSPDPAVSDSFAEEPDYTKTSEKNHKPAVSVTPNVNPDISCEPLQNEVDDNKFKHILIYDGMIIFIGENNRHVIDMQSKGYFTCSLSPDHRKLALLIGGQWSMSYEVIIIDIENFKKTSFKLDMSDEYGLDFIYWRGNNRLAYSAQVNPSVSKFMITDTEGNILVSTSGSEFHLTRGDLLLRIENQGHFGLKEEPGKLLLDNEILYQCSNLQTEIDAVVLDIQTNMLAFIEETKEEKMLKYGVIDEENFQIVNMIETSLEGVPSGGLIINKDLIITGHGSGTYEINIATGKGTVINKSISQYSISNAYANSDKKSFLEKYGHIEIPDDELYFVRIFDLM